MAITAEEWGKHVQRQTDIKGFLNVLAPFVNCTDEDLKKKAAEKAKELIGEISLNVKESVIKGA